MLLLLLPLLFWSLFSSFLSLGGPLPPPFFPPACDIVALCDHDNFQKLPMKKIIVNFLGQKVHY
jgi:hypothetical protein